MNEYLIGRIEQLVEDHAAQLSPHEIARRVGELLRNGTSYTVTEPQIFKRGKRTGRMVECKYCGKSMSSLAMTNHIKYEHRERRKAKRGKGSGTGHYPVRMLQCKICGADVKNRAMGNHMATQHRGRKEIK